MDRIEPVPGYPNHGRCLSEHENATSTGLHRNPARSYCRSMGRIIVVIVGVVVALFGLLFALQGFGMVGGSPMSNTTTWSVLGPIIALVGVAIAVAAARRRE